MKSKICCFLLIVLGILMKFEVSSLKYDHISDCHINDVEYSFVDRYLVGTKKITFNCSENKDTGFNYDSPNCNGSMYPRGSMQVINFENCTLSAYKSILVDKFPSVDTLDISDMDLDTQTLKKIQLTNSIMRFVATKNRLTEIPDIFVNASDLYFANFSNNFITRFDETLENLTNLVTLDVSYNRFSVLDFKNITTPNLKRLIVANNNITTLKCESFQKLTEMVKLDLSFNPIGDLKIETLAFLPNLEYLNLRKTNLSIIQIGTFSFQHRLISLDLSQNNLKALDFKLFQPIFHDLRQFYLAENQLNNLNGFRNSLFPRLELFDIKNNQFNCSYLYRFMETVNWQNIRFPVDKNSHDTQKESVRGIRCDASGSLDETDNYQASSRNDILEKRLAEISSKLSAYLLYMCIVLSAFFGMFLISHMQPFFKQNGKSEWLINSMEMNEP